LVDELLMLLFTNILRLRITMHLPTSLFTGQFKILTISTHRQTGKTV